MIEREPTPLDYRSPQAAPTRGVFNEPACYAGLIVSLVLLLDLLFVVPRFETIFKDFGTKLPALTQWLLDASRWTSRGLWIVFLVLPVAMGFLVARVQPVAPEPTHPGETRLPRRRRPGSWWIFRLAMLGILIIILVTVLALFLPMISLIQSVSAGK